MCFAECTTFGLHGKAPKPLPASAVTQAVAGRSPPAWALASSWEAVQRRRCRLASRLRITVRTPGSPAELGE